MKMLRLSILICIVYFSTDITGYKQKVSFPTWGEKKSSEFAMTRGMECKTFIKITTITPVQVRYTCQNRKCRNRTECSKRYICTGQVLRNVTSYKQVNVCCPGYITENGKCVRVCKGQTYGQNCSLPCNCPANAHKSCETGFGKCFCLPGWKGSKCNEKCPKGYFGDDCQHKCVCANGAICDHVTGACKCTKPGWMGAYCDRECQVGRYGMNCRKRCKCGQSNHCHPETGECVCPPGSQGKQCQEVCVDGRFGYNCSSRCVCNPENTSLCDPVSGDCNCKPGWSGITCNMVCPHGQFGEDCAAKCDCKSPDACDPFSGRCIERCVCAAEGTSNCDDRHSVCRCDQQTLENNCADGICSCDSQKSYCVPRDSECKCKKGWTGFQCNIKLSAEDLEDPEVEAEEERRTFVIVAISCVSGIVLAIGLVFAFIFCKDRFKRTSSPTGVEADEDVILDDRHTKETKLYYDSIPVNAIINQPCSSLSGSTTELIAAQSEIDTRDIMAPHIYHVLEKNGTSFDSLHRKNRIGPNKTHAGSTHCDEEIDSVSNHYHVLNPYTTVAEVNGTQSQDFDTEYPAALSAQSLNEQSESYYKSIEEFDSFTDSSFESEDEFDMRTFIRKDKVPSYDTNNEYSVISRGPQKEMKTFGVDSIQDMSSVSNIHMNFNENVVNEDDVSSCALEIPTPAIDLKVTTGTEGKAALAQPSDSIDTANSDHFLTPSANPSQTDASSAPLCISMDESTSTFEDKSSSYSVSSSNEDKKIPEMTENDNVLASATSKSVCKPEPFSQKNSANSDQNENEIKFDNTVCNTLITTPLKNDLSYPTLPDVENDEARDDVDDIGGSSSFSLMENTRRVSTLSEQFTVISELLQQAIEETKCSDDTVETKHANNKADLSPRKYKGTEKATDLQFDTTLDKSNDDTFDSEMLDSFLKKSIDGAELNH